MFVVILTLPDSIPFTDDCVDITTRLPPICRLDCNVFPPPPQPSVDTSPLSLCNSDHPLAISPNDQRPVAKLGQIQPVATQFRCRLLDLLVAADISGI